MAATFKPLERIEGYLPIEDHGLIGDGSTAALVGRDGAISWMCLPRLDSQPLFCGILDAERGGAFTLRPVDILESRQYYEPDSGVLITEMRGPTGLVRVTDALTFHSGADLTEDAVAGRSELLRMVEVLQGRVQVVAAIAPRGGANLEHHAGGYLVKCLSRPDLKVLLTSSAPLAGLKSTIEFDEGERFFVSLRWEEGSPRAHIHPPERILRDTIRIWHDFMGHFTYRGPEEALVRRSAKEATDLFCSLCRRSNPAGLLPEEIDPGSGRFLGNFPQAFSHVGLISSAVLLSRLTAGNDEKPPVLPVG